MPLPDIDDFTATFGGSKNDYAPVEDPSTDEAAATRNQYVADVAMMTNTATRGWVEFTGDASAPVLVAHNAVWGNSLAYAPVIAKTGTGVVTITLPASPNDALGNSHTTNVRAAWVNVRGAGTLAFGKAEPTSGNVITVYLFNAAGSANNLAGTNIDVFYL